MDIKYGGLWVLREMQYILNVKDTHIRLLELFAAGIDQIDSNFFHSVLKFLELFLRHNEINARALLQQNMCWRTSMEQKLLSSVYRFCSLTELEEALDQLVGVPFAGLCTIMLAANQ